MFSRRSTTLALCALLVLSGATATAGADEAAEPFSSRPDSHAPIGVMGDHRHAAGEWMLSYRFARMHMEGNRSRSEREGRNEVLQQFLVTPLEMDMDMHMIGLMVAPHDRVTLMGMLPLVHLSMDHVRRDGLEFETRSSGLGDVKASALIGILDTERHDLHANAGLSFPTGSILEKDALPPPLGRRRLPYPMQLGSGTWDFLPGLTYVGHCDWLSWGWQGLATLRTGRNSLGYRLGHRFESSAWVAHPWSDSVSTSARVAFTAWGNIHGEDDLQEPPFVPPSLVPTGDPDRRAGRRLDLLAGVNLNVPLGPFGKQRFAIELGIPVVQWLRGPQLETDWRIVVGWQRAFHGIGSGGTH